MKDIDEQISMLSGSVKAQGEDKPGMNLVDVIRTIKTPIINKNYGGSEKKGAPIKGGISGEL